jgi:hypothetical protein
MSSKKSKNNNNNNTSIPKKRINKSNQTNNPIERIEPFDYMNYESEINNFIKSKSRIPYHNNGLGLPKISKNYTRNEPHPKKTRFKPPPENFNNYKPPPRYPPPPPRTPRLAPVKEQFTTRDNNYANFNRYKINNMNEGTNLNSRRFTTKDPHLFFRIKQLKILWKNTDLLKIIGNNMYFYDYGDNGDKWYLKNDLNTMHKKIKIMYDNMNRYIKSLNLNEDTKKLFSNNNISYNQKTRLLEEYRNSNELKMLYNKNDVNTNKVIALKNFYDYYIRPIRNDDGRKDLLWKIFHT